jgi:hypothetical protein
MDRDLRLNLLLRELDRCGAATLRLENGQLHVEHGDKLTAALCDEITEMRVELLDYLRTQGEEILNDPEQGAHSNMHTLPRTPEEVDKQRADAARTRESARRRYQGGAVLVNDSNNFGHYLRQLRQQDEHRQAIERGELPREGFYCTKFDPFNY